MLFASAPAARAVEKQPVEEQESLPAPKLRSSVAGPRSFLHPAHQGVPSLAQRAHALRRAYGQRRRMTLMPARTL